MDTVLENNLNKFFSKCQTSSYKKGEIILRPGDNVDYVGYVKSGYVRVYTLSENGQEITMQVFKPMLYFTMIFSRYKIANNFYFEAITPVEMYKAPAAETWEYLSENPEVLNLIQNHIFECLLDVVRNYGMLMSRYAYNRVALTVASLADRIDNSYRDKKIDFAITHKLIASLTGLTRETVTLQMLRLENEGLIKNVKRKIIVLDRAKLTKAAQVG